MKAGMKMIVTVCLFVLAFGHGLRADDTLFQIRQNGREAGFPVTRALAAKVGIHSYMAVLPGGEGKPQAVRGPLMRDLIAACGLSGQKVWAKALDGYEMDVPMSELQQVDVLAVTEVDGQPLTIRDRGPSWLVYPTVDHPELRDAIHEARSVWQIKELLVE